MIKTSKVSGRRTLRFGNIDDAISEAERIARADADGRIRSLGNWTPGQVFGHIASWIDYGYEGYPLGKPPWLIGVILRWRVKKYLRDGLPSGVKMPAVSAGTYGTDEMTTEAGLKRYRVAFLRLKAGEPSTYDSPGFGPMSDEDRIRLNLRHAELHLSFLVFEA